VRLHGIIYKGWHNAPCFPIPSWKASKEELPHVGHQVRGGPRRKVCGEHADELGKLPSQKAREGLS
jgi:hypothetical protein